MQIKGLYAVTPDTLFTEQLCQQVTAALQGGASMVQYRNEVSRFLSNTFHIEIFPPSVYQFSEIPAEIVPSDVTIICLSAFVICSLAALITAWFAARLDPVKALRHE